MRACLTVAFSGLLLPVAKSKPIPQVGRAFPNSFTKTLLRRRCPWSMKWFLNRKTRTKLLLGFGAILFLLLAVIGVAYSALVSLKHDYGVTTGLAQMES